MKECNDVFFVNVRNIIITKKTGGDKKLELLDDENKLQTLILIILNVIIFSKWTKMEVLQRIILKGLMRNENRNNI